MRDRYLGYYKFLGFTVLDRQFPLPWPHTIDIDESEIEQFFSSSQRQVFPYVSIFPPTLATVVVLMTLLMVSKKSVTKERPSTMVLKISSTY